MEYLRIDPLLDHHPEVMEAGFWGARLFEFLLRVSATYDLRGRIPPKYQSSRWIARIWGLNDGDRILETAENLISCAIAAAVESGLIEKIDGDWVIPGWDKFYSRPKTGAERQAAYEERRATRTGEVYVIQQGADGPVKIGFSENASARIYELQFASPEKFTRLACFPGTMADEKELHKRFHSSRKQGEWFHFTEEIRNWLASLSDVSDKGTSDSVRLVRAEESDATPHHSTPHHNTNNNTLSIQKTESTAPEEQKVYEHWKQAMGKPDALFTKKRKKLVRDRLKEGFSAEEICTAIDGCAIDPWHQGQNDRHTAFNDLTLICRDAEHVEKFGSMRMEHGYG